VEDEALIRFVIAEKLRELGWYIVEIGTVDDANVLIQAGRRFDLVMTDTIMPGRWTGLTWRVGFGPQTPLPKL
jgi:CheY-like chemotaxis protein